MIALSLIVASLLTIGAVSQNTIASVTCSQCQSEIIACENNWKCRAVVEGILYKHPSCSATEPEISTELQTDCADWNYNCNAAIAVMDCFVTNNCYAFPPDWAGLRGTGLSSKDSIMFSPFEPSNSFESTDYSFESTDYSFESTDYSFESTNYGFESTNYGFESTTADYDAEFNCIGTSCQAEALQCSDSGICVSTYQSFFFTKEACEDKALASNQHSCADSCGRALALYNSWQQVSNIKDDCAKQYMFRDYYTKLAQFGALESDVEWCGQQCLACQDALLDPLRTISTCFLDAKCRKAYTEFATCELQCEWKAQEELAKRYNTFVPFRCMDDCASQQLACELDTQCSAALSYMLDSTIDVSSIATTVEFPVTTLPFGSVDVLQESDCSAQNISDAYYAWFGGGLDDDFWAYIFECKVKDVKLYCATNNCGAVFKQLRRCMEDECSISSSDCFVCTSVVQNDVKMSVEKQCINNEAVEYAYDSIDCTGSPTEIIPTGESCDCDDVILIDWSIYNSDDCTGIPPVVLTNWEVPVRVGCQVFAESESALYECSSNEVHITYYDTQDCSGTITDTIIFKEGACVDGEIVRNIRCLGVSKDYYTTYSPTAIPTSMPSTANPTVKPVEEEEEEGDDDDDDDDDDISNNMVPLDPNFYIMAAILSFFV